jgi:hypothetical protein
MLSMSVWEPPSISAALRPTPVALELDTWLPRSGFVQSIFPELLDGQENQIAIVEGGIAWPRCIRLARCHHRTTK